MTNFNNTVTQNAWDALMKVGRIRKKDGVDNNEFNRTMGQFLRSIGLSHSQPRRAAKKGDKKDEQRSIGTLKFFPDDVYLTTTPGYQRNKIAAIKLLRGHFDMGLREAKRIMDRAEELGGTNLSAEIRTFFPNGPRAPLLVQLLRDLPACGYTVTRR